MQPTPPVSCCRELWNAFCCCVRPAKQVRISPADPTVVTDPATIDTRTYVHRHQHSLDSRVGKAAEDAKVLTRDDSKSESGT